MPPIDPDATIDDAACGSMMIEVMNGLLARGLTPRQLRDALLGAAVGLALRTGWTPEDVVSVARQYAEILSKMTRATPAGEG